MTPSALRSRSHPQPPRRPLPASRASAPPEREQLTGPRNLGLMPPYEGTRYRHRALPPQGPDACARVEGNSDVRAAEERRGSRGSGRPGDGQLAALALVDVSRALGDRPGTDAAIRTDWADLSARAATRCTSSARPWSSSSESRYARYRFMPTPSFWPSRFVVVKQNTSCR